MRKESEKINEDSLYDWFCSGDQIIVCTAVYPPSIMSRFMLGRRSSDPSAEDQLILTVCLFDLVTSGY